MSYCVTVRVIPFSQGRLRWSAPQSQLFDPTHTQNFTRTGKALWKGGEVLSELYT
jgi:hypothetical protein